MDVDIQKYIFKNKPEGNRFAGRPRNSWWNFVQSDLKKSKISYGLPTETAGRGP